MGSAHLSMEVSKVARTSAHLSMEMSKVARTSPNLSMEMSKVARTSAHLSMEMSKVARTSAHLSNFWGFGKGRTEKKGTKKSTATQIHQKSNLIIRLRKDFFYNKSHEN